MGQASPPRMHVELCCQAAARVSDERISTLRDCILMKDGVSDIQIRRMDIWSVRKGSDERFIYTLLLGVPSMAW